MENIFVITLFSDEKNDPTLILSEFKGSKLKTAPRIFERKYCNDDEKNLKRYKPKLNLPEWGPDLIISQTRSYYLPDQILLSPRPDLIISQTRSYHLPDQILSSPRPDLISHARSYLPDQILSSSRPDLISQTRPYYLPDQILSPRPDFSHLPDQILSQESTVIIYILALALYLVIPS